MDINIWDASSLGAFILLFLLAIGLEAFISGWFLLLRVTPRERLSGAVLVMTLLNMGIKGLVCILYSLTYLSNRLEDASQQTSLLVVVFNVLALGVLAYIFARQLHSEDLEEGRPLRVLLGTTINRLPFMEDSRSAGAARNIFLGMTLLVLISFVGAVLSLI